MQKVYMSLLVHKHLELFQLLITQVRFLFTALLFLSSDSIAMTLHTV